MSRRAGESETPRVTGVSGSAKPSGRRTRTAGPGSSTTRSPSPAPSDRHSARKPGATTSASTVTVGASRVANAVQEGDGAPLAARVREGDRARGNGIAARVDELEVDAVERVAQVDRQAGIDGSAARRDGDVGELRERPRPRGHVHGHVLVVGRKVAQEERPTRVGTRGPVERCVVFPRARDDSQPGRRYVVGQEQPPCELTGAVEHDLEALRPGRERDPRDALVLVLADFESVVPRTLVTQEQEGPVFARSSSATRRPSGTAVRAADPSCA